MQLHPGSSGCSALAAELFDCEKLADLLRGFSGVLRAGPFLSLEILLGVLAGVVGQVGGSWSTVPRLWILEFGWALDRAFPVLRQVIDARAPTTIDADAAQWRAPLDVLAQHVRSGSGLFSARVVARIGAGFALPLEFALQILEAASLPLGRPLVVPPNRLELPPFCTPEMIDEAMAPMPVQAAFDAAVQAVRDAELQEEE